MPAIKTAGLEHLYFLEGTSRKISDLLIFKKGIDAVYKKNMKMKKNKYVNQSDCRDSVKKRK